VAWFRIKRPQPDASENMTLEPAVTVSR
jgi:hypothetical protein